MERWFLYAGMALSLFSLWVLARRDWVRMTTLSRTVDAQVTGHRVTRDVDGVHYAAIYGFSAEGVEHQVVDQVLSARPSPREGTRVVLRYPVGRPELARVPRPLLWLAVYGALIGLFGVLLVKALGGLPD